MAELTFQRKAVIWGQAFEIFVKRGTLACLAEHNLLDLKVESLAAWRSTRVHQVHRAVVQALDVVDDVAKEHIHTALSHLSAIAYGLGHSAMRAYLKPLAAAIESKSLSLRALWCPLSMPGTDGLEEDSATSCTQLLGALGLEGPADPAHGARGFPARSDFFMWLSGSHSADHLLIQEYSYDMPPSVGDFKDEIAHIDELGRFRRMVDSRGVFSHVSAEVEEEQFAISDDISLYLGALTTDNKPLFKLCQAASYTATLIDLLRRRRLLVKPCFARALAITPHGLESLAARYTQDQSKDPRAALLEQLGAAYRKVTKVADGDEAGLSAQMSDVLQQILHRLPRNVRQGLKPLRDPPTPDGDYVLEFEESISGFSNPMQSLSRAEALELVDDTPELEARFGMPARQAICRALDDLKPGSEALPLRDLHAAAIVAGMKAAKRGQLNVLGLEGNPGIGKTTAVVRYLSQQQQGYLFLYVSPRVVINRDVTEKLARRDGQPSGILTVTTNSELISAAERYHRAKVSEGQAAHKRVEGAVVADGVADLQTPNGSILVITPDQEQEIERHHAGSRFSKSTLSENEDMVEERHLPGVLSAMSSTTRDLLELNPSVSRVVLTAALQGFREKANGRSTVEALSKLFREQRDGKAKLGEREGFAKRMPTVVVMVDELAGDGAGAPFVHAVTEWLKQEFLDPFNDSPFTVILVISDASLGNDIVLARYLGAGQSSPDKVLISRSRGSRPFSMAVTPVPLASGRAKVLHIMTNSFPASELKIRYRVDLASVQLVEKDTGTLETPRQAVRRVSQDATLSNAAREILNAAEASQQIIFFAQDKAFLRELRNFLLELGRDHGLNKENVRLLDSSVPGHVRKTLVSEKVRDTIRVFLMTSSGARGVSFPKADHIIALVPRFNVESSLMEITQLIYRGRGMYKDASGNEVSGDNVPRCLVMLISDFLVFEEERDKRQWLRQSLDLMTLLVMLRASILTRITGDSGLREQLALVPVGGVGVEELLSLMSQYVVGFLNEAQTYVIEAGKTDLAGLVAKARTNCHELFSRFRLNGLSKAGTAGMSFVRPDIAREYFERASTSVAPLLCEGDSQPVIPENVYFDGPVVLENWEQFDKQEAFTFEGHQTRVDQMTRELFMQLAEIDRDDRLPGSLRKPAANLLRLLARDKPGAANEFSTLKSLKSPNTWIALPATYPQFVRPVELHDGKLQPLREPELWLDFLGRSLRASNAIMPAIPRYDDLPWAAGVGSTNPLKLDLVFNDRYFMASNELNLLNSLMLAEDRQ